MDASTTSLKGLGTWQRYKLGQQQFTKWLRQTSTKLIASGQGQEPAAEEANGDGDSASVKSKTRKKKTTKVPLEDDARFVHWTELERMAQVVASQASPEEIPAAPINILRDVVTLRKKSARFFNSSDAQDEETRTRNAGHEHIIKVLERVLGMLEGAVKSVRNGVAGGVKGAQAKDQGKHATGVSTADLANMFEYLKVEAPAEDEDADEDDESETESIMSKSTRGSKRSSKKKKPGKRGGKNKAPKKERQGSTETQTSSSNWVDSYSIGTAEPNGEDDEELDVYTLLYCFFVDFNKIRDYVRERWCDYFFDSSVSLDKLAVVTNAACQLFYDLQSDLVRTLKKAGASELADYGAMWGMLFVTYGLEHVEYGEDEESLLTAEERDEKIWKQEADWLGMPAYFSIEKTLRHIPPGKVPMMRPGEIRQPGYGATTPEGLSIFTDRAVNQMLFDTVIVKALKHNNQEPPSLPAETCLQMAFQAALREKQYTPAFVLSLQLYVDIRYIIEERVVEAFGEMQVTAKKAQQVLKAHLDKATGPRYHLKGEMRQTLKILEHYALEDFTLEDRRLRFLKQGEDPEIEPFTLYKYDPIWAGLLDMRTKVTMSDLGHEFVRYSPVVEAAAFIYSAARACFEGNEDRGLLPAWPVMDKYLATFLPESEFARTIAAGKDDPVRLLLSFDRISRKFQPFGEPKSPMLPGVGGETYVPTFGYRNALFQHLDGFGSIKQDNLYLVKILLLHMHVEEVKWDAREEARKRANGSGEVAEVVPDMTVMNDREWCKRKAEKLEARYAQMDPVEILGILESALAELDELLDLDYFQLPDESVAFLKKLSQALSSEFQAQVSYVAKKDDCLPDMLARVPVCLGELLVKMSAEDAEQTQHMFSVVAGCLREMHHPSQ